MNANYDKYNNVVGPHVCTPREGQQDHPAVAALSLLLGLQCCATQFFAHEFSIKLRWVLTSSTLSPKAFSMRSAMSLANALAFSFSRLERACRPTPGLLAAWVTVRSSGSITSLRMTPPIWVGASSGDVFFQSEFDAERVRRQSRV
jgi:hypothetical protein